MGAIEDIGYQSGTHVNEGSCGTACGGCCIYNGLGTLYLGKGTVTPPGEAIPPGETKALGEAGEASGDGDSVG